MGEVLKQDGAAEYRVFGDAYSLKDGMSDEETRLSFFTSRLEQINSGALTWLPRTLESDSGIAADLYKNSKIIATLVFEYDQGLASVYTVSSESPLVGTTLLDNVSFSDAVTAAELFADK